MSPGPSLNINDDEIKKNMSGFKTLAASLLLIMAVTFPVAVQAQMFDFGIRAGANVTSVTNSQYPTGSLTGYHFGLDVSYRLRFAPLAIEPGMYFMQMGTDYDQIQLGLQSPQPARLKINYVQLPVMVRAYLPLSGPVIPNVFGGPYVGFRTDISFQVGNQLVLQAQDWYRESDYGFMVGVGTRIGLLAVDVDIDVRLIYGMENIFDYQFEYDEQHRGIAFTAGVSF